MPKKRRPTTPLREVKNSHKYRPVCMEGYIALGYWTQSADFVVLVATRPAPSSAISVYEMNPEH